MTAVAAGVVWVLIWSGGSSWTNVALRFDSEAHCIAFLERTRPSIWVGECVPAPGLLPAPVKPGKPRPHPAVPAPTPPVCRDGLPICKPV